MQTLRLWGNMSMNGKSTLMKENRIGGQNHLNQFQNGLLTVTGQENFKSNGKALQNH